MHTGKSLQGRVSGNCIQACIWRLLMMCRPNCRGEKGLWSSKFLSVDKAKSGGQSQGGNCCKRQWCCGTLVPCASWRLTVCFICHHFCSLCRWIHLPSCGYFCTRAEHAMPKGEDRMLWQTGTQDFPPCCPLLGSANSQRHPLAINVFSWA